MANWKDYLTYYKEKIERGIGDEKMLDVIKKLQKAPITIELLQETGIGKVIKRLGKLHGIIGERATIVYNKWKDIVSKSSEYAEKCSKNANVCKQSQSTFFSKNEVNKNPRSKDYNMNGHLKQSKQKQNLYENYDVCSKYANVSSSSKKSKLERSALNHVTDYPEYTPTCKTNSKGVSYAEVTDTIYCPDDFKYEPEDVSSKYISYSGSMEFTPDMYNPEEPACDYVKSSCSSIEKEEQDLQNTADSRSFVNITEYSSQSSPEQISHVKSKSDISDKNHKKNMKLKTSKSFTGEKRKCNNNISSKPKILKSDTHVKNTQITAKYKESPKKVKILKSNVKDIDSSKSSSKIKRIKKEKLDKLNPKKHSGKKDLRLAEEEGFTCTEVSFEDCLGFNDIVVTKKKKNHTKTSNVLAKSTIDASVEEIPSSTRKRTANIQKKNTDSSNCNRTIPGSNHSHTKSNQRQNVKENSSKEKTKVSKEIIPTEELLCKPRLSDRKVDISSTLPVIQPNYRPLRAPDCPLNKKRVLSNEEAILFTSSRKEKTAVYSGRRNNYLSEVPTLMDACTRTLIENIDAIEYTGGIPYHLLKPVLERCNPKQLFELEDYNVYLLDDTGELWEKHCKKSFRNHQPQPGETWRDLYIRLFEEQENRLRSITANISASMSKYNPARQTKLAYVDSVVKPPRDVARKQAKHGTSLVINHTVKTGLALKGGPSSSTSSTSLKSGAYPVSPVAKPVIKHKTGPLMMKTLKELKRSFRR